jgi:hypothetical protein
MGKVKVSCGLAEFLLSYSIAYIQWKSLDAARYSVKLALGQSGDLISFFVVQFMSTRLRSRKFREKLEIALRANTHSLLHNLLRGFSFELSLRETFSLSSKSLYFS